MREGERGKEGERERRRERREGGRERRGRGVHSLQHLHIFLMPTAHLLLCTHSLNQLH